MLNYGSGAYMYAPNEARGVKREALNRIKEKY